MENVSANWRIILQYILGKSLRQCVLPFPGSQQGSVAG